MLSNGQIGVEIFFFVISGSLNYDIARARMGPIRNDLTARLLHAARVPDFRLIMCSFWAILSAMRFQWVSIANREWLSSLLFFWNYLPVFQ